MIIRGVFVVILQNVILIVHTITVSISRMNNVKFFTRIVWYGGLNMSANKNKEYILAVKNNLRSFLYTANYKIDEYGRFSTKDEDDRNKKFKTLTYLCDALQKKSNDENNSYWLSKPDNKLKNIFSIEKASIDPYFINEICELYNFPVEKVFSVKKISVSEAEEIMEEVKKDIINKQKPFAPLSKLTHKAYFGDFYGYTFDHNPNEDEIIIKFYFSIYEDENYMPKAKYVFYNQNQEEQVFEGTPYYISELKTICIEMSASNNSRYQYLYFNGTPYNSQNLIYKNGVCVRTSTASKNHEPDVKSFIITGYELPNHVVETIIPGLLKMTKNDFYILSSQLDRLEQENENIKIFCEKYNSDLQLVNNCVCLVRERKILENTVYDSKSERIFAFECLTTIKAFALAPNQIQYRNTEADYNYFKQIEQELNDALSY